MVQEALARPFEGTVLLAAIAGGSAINVPIGVYASLWTYMEKFEDVGITAGKIQTVRLNSDYKVEIVMNGSQTLVLDLRPRELLGFNNLDLGAGTTHTAENVSPYLWLPTFHGNNIDLWEPISENYFAGSGASDGSRAGFKLGPDRYKRTLQYSNEPPLNLSEDGSTNDITAAGGLLNFLRESITVQTTSATSSNISAKGFYYCPNIDASPFNSEIVSMDSGGVQYSLSSSPDTYTFCTYPPSDLPRLTNALGRARVRYNVDIPIESAVAPTWLVDGS